jgi:cellulose biosynthesis protein BcsQ
MDILEGKTPNVVAFWSVKGGVGRTTLAAAVGIKRALEGKKVLLIDMDLEAPSLDLVTFSEMPPDNDVLTVDGLLLELQEFENEFRVSETDKIEKVMKELEGKEEKLKWKFNEALFKGCNPFHFSGHFKSPI